MFLFYLIVFWLHVVLCLQKTVPEKLQIQGGALPNFVVDFLTILGLILAHFGSLLQLCWPPWTSFGPPWTSFGQPWVPCGQKFPVPVSPSPLLVPLEVTFGTPFFSTRNIKNGGPKTESEKHTNK